MIGEVLRNMEEGLFRIRRKTLVSLTTSLHGAGYGRRALRLVIEHFAARGHHRFTIDPNVENERAIRVYRRMGFRRVKTLYKAVAMPLT